jgi:uncharacterized SAM-binding protein YcdF (DUF218 family)
MFFIFSKLLIFLLNPFIWFLLCLFTGLILKTGKIRKIILSLSVAILLVFSNTFLFNQVAGLWEVDPVKSTKLDDHYSHVIVLGGFSSYHKEAERVAFHESAGRFLHGLKFYKSGKANKLVITGGSARIFLKDKKEANIIADFLNDFDVPKQDLIIESESRNTHENAQYTARLIVDSTMQEKVLLITSAFHMKRAKACFEEAGFKTDGYPVHYITNTGPFNPASVFIPGAGVFGGWSLLMKEWAGYLVYDLKGYF